MGQAMATAAELGSVGKLSPWRKAAAPAATGNLPQALRGAQGVVLVWLVCCLLLVLVSLPAIRALRPGDPDDYMRLQQVRDLLHGQSWFDVHQYRMNPPLGAAMHWSRLVDVPIAACLLLARLFLAEPMASAAAMTAVPLLQLLLTMFLLRRLLLALGESETTALIAGGIVLLFPMLLSNFMPLRIDHHGWQAIMALACITEWRRRGRVGAWLAGALAAVWLAISLEGVLLVACLAGLMGLRYLLRREAALAHFLSALAATSLPIYLLTRPLAGLLHPTCDTVGWPHMTAFAVCGALAAVLMRLPAQQTMMGRFAGLSVVAGIGAALIALPLGPCAVDPYYGMDALIRTYWFANISEGLPLTGQDPHTAAMLVWTLGLVLGGWAMVWRGGAQRPEGWTELGLFALAAIILSLLMLRGAVAAQLLTVPFSAVLIARLLPRARALANAPARIVATLAALLMLTPSFASAGGKLLENALARPGQSASVHKAGPLNSGTCDFSQLVSLPRAHLFATLDPGPEILVRTPHSVVAGDYHRSFIKMHEVMEAFGGDPAKAQAIVRANHAAYVVMCASTGESQILASRRGDSLAAGIRSGRTPLWLTPQPGFSGALKVYAVRVYAIRPVES
jgi:hypothetical protein